MKSRPILFQGTMVNAILRAVDPKTQTRRIAKLTDAAHVKEPGGHRRWHPADPEAIFACPYGQVGDRLWVREAWRTVAEADALPPRDLTPAHRIWYEAQDEVPFHQSGFGKLRPSMFMPRWACRLELEITDRRLERLQDITEVDAKAEGTLGGHGAIPDYSYSATAFEHYHWLWNSINGNGSFESNPLVWVVEFKRVLP
jgi:hypothetical protein